MLISQTNPVVTRGPDLTMYECRDTQSPTAH